MTTLSVEKRRKTKVKEGFVQTTVVDCFNDQNDWEVSVKWLLKLATSKSGTKSVDRSKQYLSYVAYYSNSS